MTGSKFNLKSLEDFTEFGFAVIGFLVLLVLFLLVII